MSSLIPQAIVTLSPEGDLQVEQHINGVRRITPLPIGTAGQRLRQMLITQKRKIEDGSPGRKRASHQPDWYLIAKHPQVEIRQMLPGRGLDTSSQEIKGKTLEELGL